LLPEVTGHVVDREFCRDPLRRGEGRNEISLKGRPVRRGSVVLYLRIDGMAGKIF